jgi:signal transduction histidine kinase
MIATRELDDFARRRPYVTSGAMVLVVTLIGFATESILRAANLDLLYLLAVFISALYCGERPAIFTAIGGAIVFNFCFIPPRFSWAVTDLPYLVTLFVFVVIAIATARLASEARRRLLEHAAREKAEALSASKDELLHRISHELRSPMTAVLGWTQLLRMENAARDDPSHSLTGLENSAQLLRHLIDDLVDASRAAAGKLSVHLQPVMLAPAVSKALDGVSITARAKNVAIERALEDVVVLADEVRVQQIVTNLVTNAVKFTPAGGRVAVSLTHAGAEARIVVRDNGRGISAEFLPHVFEPFRQSDPDSTHGGLGLGLAIVKYLVEAHHGSISVTSEGPGRGATFIVAIPALDDVPVSVGSAA